jgi:hypothetical protein
LGLQKYFIFVIHQILTGFFCAKYFPSFLKVHFNFSGAKKMMFPETPVKKGGKNKMGRII